MAIQAYQRYQRTQAETASPGQLIVMMYDGAIKFLTAARQRLDAGDLEATNRNLQRAQEIILELMISVDVGIGPVARNLFDLYEFMHNHLVQANCRKDPAMIEEVVQLLRELVPAWEQATTAGQKVAAAGAAGPPEGGLRLTSA